MIFTRFGLDVDHRTVKLGKQSCCLPLDNFTILIPDELSSLIAKVGSSQPLKTISPVLFHIDLFRVVCSSPKHNYQRNNMPNAMLHSTGFSMGKRLSLTMAIVTLMLTASAGFISYQLFATTKTMKSLINNDLELAQRAERWSLMVQVNVARAFVRANVDLGTYKNTFETDAQAMSQRIGEAQAAMEALVKDDAIRTELDKVIEVRKKTVAITDKIGVLKTSSSKEVIDDYITNTYTPQAKIYLDALDGLAKFAHQSALNKIAFVDDNNVKLFNIIGVMIILAVLFAIFLTRQLQSTISTPLQHALVAAHAIATGDLTHDILRQGKAEFGQLTNALADMQESLQTTVSQIHQATNTVTEASEGIAKGNRDLSERTTLQTSSIESTVETMSQLTDTVKQNAFNTQKTNALAASASTVAIDGGNAMDAFITTMQEINTSSNKISEIITVIDGIAFQTNILALNAAVEAARAGEQGRGFAVVASEVRVLAQRSATAAKEIKILIDDSVQKVSSGSTMAIQAGDKIKEVVSSVQSVTEMVAEISMENQKQSTGIEDIGHAFLQIEEITRQNATLVESIAETAESLQNQSVLLSKIVRTFKLAGIRSYNFDDDMESVTLNTVYPDALIQVKQLPCS